MTCLPFSINGQHCTFLLDTGASLSVIHKEKVPNYVKLISNNTSIRGIGGYIESKQRATLCLVTHNGVLFKHTFHVLQDMPCQTDGIIGSDFLRNYNAIINYPLQHITLQTERQDCVIKCITNASSNIYLTLPARSESIHFLNIDSHLQHYYNNCEYLVVPKELSNNIFLASILVSPKNGKIPVRTYIECE